MIKEFLCNVGISHTLFSWQEGFRNIATRFVSFLKMISVLLRFRKGGEVKALTLCLKLKLLASFEFFARYKSSP